jgi:hypothetical protein
LSVVLPKRSFHSEPPDLRADGRGLLVGAGAAVLAAERRADPGGSGRIDVKCKLGRTSQRLGCSSGDGITPKDPDPASIVLATVGIAAVSLIAGNAPASLGIVLENSSAVYYPAGALRATLRDTPVAIPSMPGGRSSVSLGASVYGAGGSNNARVPQARETDSISFSASQCGSESRWTRLRIPISA